MCACACVCAGARVWQVLEGCRGRYDADAALVACDAAGFDDGAALLLEQAPPPPAPCMARPSQCGDSDGASGQRRAGLRQCARGQLSTDLWERVRVLVRVCVCACVLVFACACACVRAACGRGCGCVCACLHKRVRVPHGAGVCGPVWGRRGGCARRWSG